MTYEPVNGITDELLAMRWHSDSAARMWFSRRNAAPGRLGLRIVEDGGEFRVERKSAVKSADPRPAADFEEWATEVDALLLDADQPAETEETLMALFGEALTAANAAQRIITRRARGLEPVKLAPPPVVGDTLADQAAAVHADSKPVPPRNEVVLHLITTEDMAPIVARRLSQITGASVAWTGNRVDAPYDDSVGSGRR